jgi:hypothetical protein
VSLADGTLDAGTGGCDVYVGGVSMAGMTNDNVNVSAFEGQTALYYAQTMGYRDSRFVTLCRCVCSHVLYYWDPSSGLFVTFENCVFIDNVITCTYTLYLLEKETAYYKAHRTELREKYAGRRVVIADDQILGIYDTDREAIDATTKTRPIGTFMVKDIPLDPEDEIAYFYGPVYSDMENVSPSLPDRIDFEKMLYIGRYLFGVELYELLVRYGILVAAYSEEDVKAEIENAAGISNKLIISDQIWRQEHHSVIINLRN